MASSSPACRAAAPRTRALQSPLRARPSTRARGRSETAANRARVLLKVADLIDRDREALALMDTLESGKPIAQARGEIEGAADIWRYAASLARELSGESYANLGGDRLGVVLREPIGVVSIITPWNFPLLIVSQKLPFALAAGCTCVVKPSEMTSASTLHLGALLAEAGLPEGVCNIVTGYGPDVGAPMTSDPEVDMISFTGSTAVGRAAMAAGAATLKKVSMELGGKNPQVIFPDADMDAALDAATFGAYFNAGECCNAGSRLLLHADIAEEFLAGLAERSKLVKVGDPLDPETRVGAIISADHLGKIESHVKAAREGGASVRTGGARLDSSGLFMAPTIVAGVGASMAIAREEVFGPVVVALTFETLDEADRACQFDRLRPLGERVEPRPRHRHRRRARRARRHGLGQHLHGRRAGAAVWRLPPVGRRPRAWPQRRQGLHRRKNVSRPHRPAHEHGGSRAEPRDIKNRGPRKRLLESGAGPCPAGATTWKGRTMKLRRC